MTAQEINDEMDFKRHFRELNPDERVEFIGSHVYTLSKQFNNLPCVENGCAMGMSRKEKLTLSGICALIAACIAGIAQIITAVMSKPS